MPSGAYRRGRPDVNTKSSSDLRRAEQLIPKLLYRMEMSEESSLSNSAPDPSSYDDTHVLE